jgi:hypothetical protein
LAADEVEAQRLAFWSSDGARSPSATTHLSALPALAPATPSASRVPRPEPSSPAAGTPRAVTYPPMVRPDRTAAQSGGGSCCIELAGESPAAVSAGAPRSRPRAWEEILPSEWGVESPQRVVRRVGGEQVRRPSVSEPYSPVTYTPERSGRPSRSFPGEGNRLHQCQTGAVQDARGVGRRACGHSSVRNRRGPSRRPTSGEGGPYKPSVKGDRAGRESEEPVVLTTPRQNRGRGKGPCFGHGRDGR